MNKDAAIGLIGYVSFLAIGLLLAVGFAIYENFNENTISPGHIITLNGVGEVIEHGPKDVSKGEVLLVEGSSVFVRVERSDILKFKLEDVTRE